MLGNEEYTVHSEDKPKIYTMLELVEQLTKLLETTQIAEFLATLQNMEQQLVAINQRLGRIENEQTNQTKQIADIDTEIEEVNESINETNNELDYIRRSLGVIDGGLADIIG